MPNKHKRPNSLPHMNLLLTVTHQTWIKLITLAATLGIGRLELYRQALTWAINQQQFVIDMAKVYTDKSGDD